MKAGGYKKRKIASLILGLFTAVGLLYMGFFPIVATASTSPASFIEAPVWFSEEPKEGASVTVSTALMNQSTSVLSGTVSFYDRETLLGKAVVSIPSRGVRVASITWIATAGDHRISAELSNAKLGEGKNAISLTSVTTEEIRANVTRAIAVAPPRNDREGTPEGKQLEVVDALQEKITTSLPALTQTAEKVDAFRIRTAEKASVWKEEAKEAIAVKNEGSGSKVNTTENPAKPFSPFTYVKLFLGTILSVLLGNPIICYGVAIIVLIFTTRAIINRISDD